MMINWHRARLALARIIRLDLTHSQERWIAFLHGCVRDGDRWLDIGCGRCLAPEWAEPLERQRALAAKAAMLVGIDLDPAMREHPLLTHAVFASGYRLPFPDGSFDLLTANMVVEHMERPEELLAEVKRVLAPGGRWVFHTPNKRYYLVAIASVVPEFVKTRLVGVIDQRTETEFFPTFYRMNSTARIRALAEDAGFQVRELKTANSSGTLVRFGPVCLMEILMMKLLSWRWFKSWRTTIIAALVKPGA